MSNAAQTFALTLRATRGTDAVCALHGLLKVALRGYGFHAIDAWKIPAGSADGAQHAGVGRIQSFSWPSRGAGGRNAKRAAGRKKMRMSEYMGSPFLRVDDLKQSGPIKATIADVRLGKFDKPDAYLSDGSVLSLNATNCRTLGRAYGDESDDWLGREIELSVGEVDYQGKPTEAILVKPISPPIVRKTAPKPTAGNGGDMDDAIPF